MTPARILLQALICALSLIDGLGAQEEAAASAMGSAPVYAVVVSDRTADTDGWHAVVEKLVEKHRAYVVRYPKDVDASLPELRAIQPDFIAFVAMPAEAERSFIVKASRLTRHMGDDPYPSCRWGVITGYDAADALRMASCEWPLLVQRAASTSGPAAIASTPGGFATFEGNATDFWTKNDGIISHVSVEPDPTRAFCETFNSKAPHYLITSNREDTGELKLGYGQYAGVITCEQGQLSGVNTRHECFPINSPVPKVYLAAGNDRGGLIDGPNCMPIGWMHSGGVDQLIGYMADDWYGFTGWSVADLFSTGSMDFSDAFFFSGVDLVHRLQTRYKNQPAVKHGASAFDSYLEQDVDFVAIGYGLTRALGHGEATYDDDLVGLLWDQDAVAFYGDPAWAVSLPAPTFPSANAWSVGFTTLEAPEKATSGATRIGSDGAALPANALVRVTCILTSNITGSWPQRPIMVGLPDRLNHIHIIAGKELEPVVTSSFILLPMQGKCKAGSSVQVTFEGRRFTRPDIHALTALSRETARAVDLVPPLDQPTIRDAILRSGRNARSLADALEAGDAQVRSALTFLIANMPTRDLDRISGQRLTSEVQEARSARRQAPWGAGIPQDIFQDYVLPYACLDESRSPWRSDLCQRFGARAWACPSISAAVLMLNQAVFKDLHVRYHPTKRPRPNQSPQESMEAGYASCSGLSILLVDACRACAIPARIVGIVDWTDGKGDAHGNHGHNHTWVEIWDSGHWHYLGASELTALDQTWFSAKCRGPGVDARDPVHCIYATSFRRTGITYPMVWAPGRDWIPALDVTSEYAESAR